MTKGFTIECKVHFRCASHGRKVMNQGQGPKIESLGRVPRISRLMALAIRMEKLVADGEVADYADLARLAHVSGARITQIMNLLHLAPDIQEELLFLSRTEHGHDSISELMVRPISAVIDWKKQRRMWEDLKMERYER